MNNIQRKDWLSSAKVLEGGTSEVSVNDVLTALVSDIYSNNASVEFSQQQRKLKTSLYHLLLTHRKGDLFV